MCFPALCLGELERTNSAQKDVWSSGMASSAFKMINPNWGENGFPSCLGVTLGYCCNALVCSCTSLFSFCLFFPFFCAEKACGNPEHHDLTNPSGAAAPDKQFLGEKPSGVWIQLCSPSEGEAHLPEQGLLLLWPQIFLAMKGARIFSN